MSRFVSASVLAVLFSAQMGHAQNLREVGPPAELPPSSYSANQYVDSRGCVFLRAGIGGAQSWVPRVSRDRRAMCGFQPSIAAAAPVVPSPTAEAPVIAMPDPANAIETPPTTTPTTRPAQRPERVGPPLETVASIPAVRSGNVNVTRPTEAQLRNAPNPLATSPRTVSAPQAATTAPVAPEAQTAAQSTASARLTRAQICDGNFGVQSRYVNAQTREPIDCGPAPSADVPAPAQPEARPTLTMAEACAGRYGIQRRYINARTGNPIDCGAAPVATPAEQPVAETDGLRRVTLAQICSEMAQTGRSFVNHSTGLPIDCSSQTPASPTQVASITAPATGNAATLWGNCGWQGETSAGRSGETRCGPQTQSLHSGASTHATTATTTRAAQQNLFGARAVPDSNPGGAARMVHTPPAGYAPVWTDGRINPQRGLPRQVSYATQSAAPLEARISSRSPAPAPADISQDRYVQVATYTSQSNAQDVAKSLRALGLPMRVGVFTRAGQEMRVVVAGPFGTDARMQRALQTVHGAGYSSAHSTQ